MELDRITDRPWCLRPPVAQAYRDRVLVTGDAPAGHEGRPMVGVSNADPPAAVACFGHGEPLRHEAAAQLARAITPPSC